MGITRSDYNTIQEMIKRIRSLEKKLIDTEMKLNSLISSVNKISTNAVGDWTQSEWEELLLPIISVANKKLQIKNHTHENNQQGGPAFADKGAKLQ